MPPPPPSPRRSAPRPHARGAGPLATTAALLLTVAALALIVVWLGVRAEDRAERAYADLRLAFVPDSVEELGRLDDVLRESSGLAVSRAHPGVLWSHNDSGDEARFYALDATGAVTATFDLTGVEALDWEDLDRGPCPSAPQRSCLWIGDIGDNVRRRDILTVHVVPEPDPASGSGAVEPLGRFRYLYPDGSRDAEALAVSPVGDLVVVTKGRAPDIVLYHVDAATVAAAVAADEPLRLPPGAVLPITPDWDVGRVVTGASFRPDGSALAVRTLSEIYFFTWPDLAEAASPCFLGTREPQGEAIAWEPSGSLLLSSETNLEGPGRLTRVWCGPR